MNRKYVSDINEVSNYLLSKQSMSPKKLQKLLYYAYAWFLYLNNEQISDDYICLFEEKPEAWIHGPVFNSIYHKYKNYGFNSIEKRARRPIIKDDRLIDFINQILKVYGKFSADELEYMTHTHTPWIDAHKKDTNIFDVKHIKLDDKKLFKYFTLKAGQ